MRVKLFILALLLPGWLFAQQPHVLYLHIDKSVYAHHESIWFAGYLLKAANIHQHQLLNVFLIRHTDRKIFAAEKYSMENGLSAGALALPDSIVAGRYQLVAYTGMLNDQNYPAAIFSVPVTVTRNGQTGATTRAALRQHTVNTTSNVAQLIVKADKEKYRVRDSVQLNIQIKDSTGKPLQGLFSVSVVLESYLTDDFRPITAAHASDTTNTLHTPAFTGTVTRKGKPLKNPVNIAAMGSAMMGLLTTASDGSFTMEPERLYAENDRRIALMVTGSAPQAYRIQVNDPYDAVNHMLAKQIPVSAQVSQDQPPATDFQGKVMDIKTVTIKARKTNYGRMRGDSGVNACGDWVDEYNFLNYPYSKERYKPIVGQLYERRIDRDGMRIAFRVEPVWYTGCESEKSVPVMLLVPGIYGPKPFEGANDEGQPQYLTTVHWEAGVFTGEDGLAQLRFKLGDLPGRFRIVVQGIAGAGLVSAKDDEIEVE